MLTWLSIQGQLGKQLCGKEGHRNCLADKESIEVNGKTLTKDNWYIVVEEYREIHPQAGIKICLDQYGICPHGIVSPMSIELWNLYQACGGLSRIAKPSEYYELPSLYVDAVRVIDNEIHRIEEIRKSNDAE